MSTNTAESATLTGPSAASLPLCGWARRVTRPALAGHAASKCTGLLGQWDPAKHTGYPATPQSLPLPLTQAAYLFQLDLPLINQLSDHAGHRHHPREHHYQGEEEADVVQEPVGTGRSASRLPQDAFSESSSHTSSCSPYSPGVHPGTQPRLTLWLGQNHCWVPWFWRILSAKPHRAE